MYFELKIHKKDNSNLALNLLDVLFTVSMVVIMSPFFRIIMPYQIRIWQYVQRKMFGVFHLSRLTEEVLCQLWIYFESSRGFIYACF